MSDIISLSIDKVEDECSAVGILYVYRALDCSETETEVLVNFDYQPEEKMTHDYPGCCAFATINEVLHLETRDSYNTELIDNLDDAEDEIIASMGSLAYEQACERAEYERDCEKDRRAEEAL